MISYRGIITLKTKTTTQTIVNEGLSSFLDFNVARNYLNYCRLGSGTTAAQVTDTALESPVGDFSNISTFAGATETNSLILPYWFGSRRDYVFPAGTFNEEDLTEVGFFSGNVEGTATMFSRTLFTDLDDNITPINVLSDEDLTVTYEIRKYPPLDDVLGSFDIGATTYNYTLRSARATDSSSWGAFNTMEVNQVKLYETDVLGPIESIPVGASETLDVEISDAEWGHDVTISIPHHSANYATGIGAIVFGATTTGDMYQMSFSPKIPKTEDITYSLRNILSIRWGNR